MRKAALMCVLVLVAVSTSFAQTTQPKPAEQQTSSDYWFNFSSRVVSQYVGSSGCVASEKPVVQSEATFWFPRIKCIPGRAYLDIWHSAGFDSDLSSDYADEIDYTVGWFAEVEKVGIDIGVSYFDSFELFNGRKGDLIRPYFEINRKFDLTEEHSVTPFFKTDFLISAMGYDVAHGVRSRLGVKHAWQINPQFSFNQKACFVFDDGACGLDSGVLGEYQCGFNWKVNDWLSFEPISFRVISPFSSLSDGRETQTVFGCGFSIKF